MTAKRTGWVAAGVVGILALTSCGSSAPERKLSESEAESLLPPLEAVPQEFGASGEEYAPRAYSEGGDSGVETAEFIERQTYMTEGLQKPV